MATQIGIGLEIELKIIYPENCEMWKVKCEMKVKIYALYDLIVFKTLFGNFCA